MPRTRTDFTEKQRAAIFRRDRATCCFSGANLWLLDAPLRYDSQTDWVDHIKPASRGGKSDPTNGVCASHTFNFRKRNNSSDTTYLFRDGAPTSLYFSLFGAPPKTVTERLVRLSRLEQADWYFNRMIVNLRLALQYHWASETWDSLPVRDDKYWLKAAYTKSKAFEKLSSGRDSIVQRLLPTKPAKHQAILLSLASSGSLSEFSKNALRLLPGYRINSNIWWNYFYPAEAIDSGDAKKCDRHRRKTYEKARSNRNRLTCDIFACIHADHSIRFPAN